MEDTVTLFVQQSRQLLADLATQSRPSDSKGAAQHQFIANFTRMIEDFLDSLRAQGVAVGAQLTVQLLECCAQMACLANSLGAQRQDREVMAHVEALQRRLGRFIEAPPAQDKRA